MKDKKGVIGKIFLVIFLVILIIAGVTAYQVYDLYQTANQQKAAIESEAQQLIAGDCSKISSIETRVVILETKANSACNNPIINIGSKKAKDLPYHCSNLTELKKEAEQALTTAKNACDLKTLNNFTEQKINEYLANITLENYKEYATKYNISSENKTVEEVKDLIANISE